jgi:beta-glucosidase
MTDHFSRRTFARLLGAGAATLSTPLSSLATGSPAPTSHRDSDDSIPANAGELKFPNGFVWGSATASYQVEGASKDDGKGESIWDVFAHTPGKIHENENGEVADDDYHRYKEDIGIMKDLGLKGARFSIAWPRIFPNGTGQVNQAGLDHYRKVVDEMLEQGIEPYCTLYHWDLPQALQEKGGWENPDTARAFADYAGFVASKLSDRVHHWMTMNEIHSFTQAGYGFGLHSPGLHVGNNRLAQLTHHAVWGHGLGVQSIRAHANGRVKVGLADDPKATCPVLATPEHIRAARAAFQEENAQFLNVVMTGRYTDRYLKRLGADAPKFTPDEMKTISTSLDFVGLNVYTPVWVRADDSLETGYKVVPNPTTYPHMDPPGISVGPEALFWAPILAHRVYNIGALYITENGASSKDFVTDDGHVWDTGRTMYLRNYLSQLHRAIQAGAPVKGYFLWSLLDNFEWADGYSSRFGITYVDFQTQKRIPKLSSEFYKAVIAANAVA